MVEQDVNFEEEEVNWKQQYAAVHAAYRSLVDVHATTTLEKALMEQQLKEWEGNYLNMANTAGEFHGKWLALQAEQDEHPEQGWEKWQRTSVELMQYITECQQIGELEPDEYIDNLIDENMDLISQKNDEDNIINWPASFDAVAFDAAGQQSGEEDED